MNIINIIERSSFLIKKIEMFSDCISNHFNNEFISFIEDFNEEIPLGLTKEQYFLMSEYIGYSYNLNQYLRTTHEKQNEMYECWLSGVTSVIDIIPSFDKRNILFRGTQIPRSIFNEYIQSSTFSDRAFLSTTLNRNLARNHMCYDLGDFPDSDFQSVIFEIHLHTTGKHLSKYFGELSTDGPEIIFQPNTRFNIFNSEETEFLQHIGGGGREIRIIKMNESPVE